MLSDYLSRAHTLADTGQPFVIATVVRAEAPTSAKAGAKAIVTADGVLNGWVGGSCTQPTVVRESLRALADGQPRFLRMCPPEKMRGSEPGITEVALACISGGTLEIYLEPHLPAPQLLIIGHLPVVEALAALAKAMHYTVTVAGENATRERFPHADRITEFDSEQLTFTPQTYVVVASHGNYDEPALELALRSEAAYVALVASKKRRDAVLDYLRGSGLSEAQLARLRCPAGLDFGAVTPEEIALSVLAEIVQLRRRGQVAGGEWQVASGQSRVADHSITPLEATDPVCGMTVEIATAKWKSEYNGQWYYFCAPGCQRTFDKDPGQFVISKQ